MLYALIAAGLPVGFAAPALAEPTRTDQVRPGVISGRWAPALSLDHLEGDGHFDLADYATDTKDTCPRAVLVAFLASWCGPCAASLPTLAQIQRDHPELLVVVVTMDEDEGGRRLELRKVRDAGLTGPVLRPDPEVVDAWTGGARSVPRFVFVDGKGVVVTQDHGFGDDVKERMPLQARRTLAR